jgi:hypothetical protein
MTLHDTCWGPPNEDGSYNVPAHLDPTRTMSARAGGTHRGVLVIDCAGHAEWKDDDHGED